MKRFWIGICVLLLLLASGWFTTILISRSHTPISRNLELASQAALAGDWASATAHVQNAQTQWDRCRDLTAALADHGELDEMESLFAQVQVYQQTRSQLSFCAACAHLSRLAQAMAESHLPIWQNLL